MDSPGIFSFKGSSINEITRDLDQAYHSGASLVQQPTDIKSPVFSHKELEARGGNAAPTALRRVTVPVFDTDTFSDKQITIPPSRMP